MVTITGGHLQAIATNTKNIVDNAAAVNHSATSKVEYLDYTQIPKDLKVGYLRKLEGEQIARSDIKQFKNEITEDARGTQQHFNFVEFRKARWSYIIYSNGTYFQCLGQQQNFKYLVSWFKTSLQPMHAWNSLCFYYLYHDLEKQCCNCFIWVLPYNLHRRQHLDPSGFLVADPHVKNNSDLWQQLGCYVNEWSGQIFQALSEDGVIPK